MARKPQTTSTPNLRHKIFSIIGAILCILLIPILLINCTLILRSFTNSDEVPSIAGIAPMIVLTDSMYPNIQSGDLIIVHTTEAETIQVGDVIAFFDPSSSNSAVVTHTVVEITTQNGSLAWRTKGDANTTEDAELVPAANLVGIYTGTRLPGIGSFVLFLSTTWGLVIFVGIPLVLLIGYDLIRRRLYEQKNQQDTEALLAELTALKAERAAKAEAETPSEESL